LAGAVSGSVCGLARRRLGGHTLGLDRIGLDRLVWTLPRCFIRRGLARVAAVLVTHLGDLLLGGVAGLLEGIGCLLLATRRRRLIIAHHVANPCDRLLLDAVVLLGDEARVVRLDVRVGAVLLHRLRAVLWRRRNGLLLLLLCERLLQSFLLLDLLGDFRLLLALLGPLASPLRLAGVGHLEIDLDGIVLAVLPRLLGLRLQPVGQVAEDVIDREVHR
jgi:hypothetical protein